MKCPPSGSGATKKKAYYLADVMQFAVPFIKTAIPPSPGNLPEMPGQQTTQVLSPSTSDYDENTAENDTEPASFSQQPSPPFSPPPPPLQQTAQTKRNAERSLITDKHLRWPHGGNVKRTQMCLSLNSLQLRRLNWTKINKMRGNKVLKCFC
ncbi:unnamed protein product [Acanthoscelides obtectus]|uniref:Uncharacterized protein n=1 Tax=Acanthoscelides obtectus TaxID=200917 RepID=A0A9P0NV09_ACAOB|nr:unnamed protein product [Acanthoscelides obtectus]CAK1641354.1 hypothetical protein AOBTE_LOCUS12354 [Acanthoscelides obtectus]